MSETKNEPARSATDAARIRLLIDQFEIERARAGAACGAPAHISRRDLVDAQLDGLLRCYAIVTHRDLDDIYNESDARCDAANR